MVITDCILILSLLILVMV